MAILKITEEVEKKEQGSYNYRSTRAAVMFSDLYVLDLNQPPSCSEEEAFGETDMEEEIALVSTRVRVSDEGVTVESSDVFVWDLNQPPLWSMVVKEEQPLEVKSTGLHFLDLNQPPVCSFEEMFVETDKVEEEVNLNSSRAARVRARVSDDDECLDHQAGKRQKTMPEDRDKAEEERQVAGLQNVAAGEDEMLYCGEGGLLLGCENSDDDYVYSWTVGVEDCPSPVVSSVDVQDDFYVQLEGFPSPVVYSVDVQDDFYVQLECFPSQVVSSVDVQDDFYVQLEGFPSPVVSSVDVQDDFYIDLEGFPFPSPDEVQNDANFTTGDAGMFDDDDDDAFGIWLENRILEPADDDDEDEPRKIQLPKTHRATADVAPAA